MCLYYLKLFQIITRKQVKIMWFKFVACDTVCFSDHYYTTAALPRSPLVSLLSLLSSFFSVPPCEKTNLFYTCCYERSLFMQFLRSLGHDLTRGHRGPFITHLRNRSKGHSEAHFYHSNTLWKQVNWYPSPNRLCWLKGSEQI